MNQWYKFIKEEDWTEFFQLLEESIHDIDYVQFFIGIRTLGETLESTPEVLVIRYRDIHTYLDNEGEITNKESSPFYYEKIRLEFKIDYEKIRQKTKIDLREYQIKQLRWWRVCVDQEDSYIQFYFDLSKHDRESEIKAVLGVGDDLSGSLTDFYRTEPGNIYGDLSSLWFLKRYDVKSARKIIDELLQEEQKSNFLEPISNFILSAYSRLYERKKSTLWWKYALRIRNALRQFLKSLLNVLNPLWMSFSLKNKLCNAIFNPLETLRIECFDLFRQPLSKFYGFVKKRIFWWFISFLILLTLLMVAKKVGEPLSFTNAESKIVYNPSYFFRIPICLVYAYITSKIIEVLHKPIKMRLLIPRLLCSISLGFLVLVIGDEVWKYAVTVSPWIWGSGIIASLIISYIYLRTEI